EREILRLVVTSFVSTAAPVGSRPLVRRYGLDLSPATIRNTMSDLEEAGYLEHPHTSAGRVPTDLGYRTFVDELMQATGLSEADKAVLRAELERLTGQTDDVLRESSKLLGRLTSLLGVVLAPNLATGVLDRIEAVPLSISRVMFVLSLRGGLVRTIVLELDAVPGRGSLDTLVQELNERLAGLTLEEIRRTFPERVRDVDDRHGLVRLILDRSHALFAPPEPPGRVRVSGTQHLIEQPEFREPDELRTLVGLLEDEHFLVELLEKRDGEEPPPGRAVVTIGREHPGRAERYALVTARYCVGDAAGTIGVVGPTRMDYARVVGLVEHMANLLSRQE
ncbi:MAG TPA: heat-inducible transcriptional repressor HrcA, partial [Rhodothermales bacterium]|nr:heat-inducible transcriptional repressor HrcA [Rhodothermales bacterium]